MRTCTNVLIHRMPLMQKHTLLWLFTEYTHIHTQTQECLTRSVYHESLCWSCTVTSTAVRPERQREREGGGRHAAGSLCLHPLSLSLFFSSSPFFSIQLSSKALYWHDCPKLTIQLQGFTLQSLSCCVSLGLSLEISSVPLSSPLVSSFSCPSTPFYVSRLHPL